MDTSEEELVKGCLAGIPRFQRTLYKRYAAKMLGVCMRYAHNKEEAEDILHEGFMIVFDKMSQFKMQGSFEGWIRRIMVNKSIEHYRKAKPMYSVVDIENVEEDIASPADVLSTIAANELLKMIQELSPIYKMVFNLAVFEQMSHKEIGETLGIAEGTSRSNLSNAKAILKRKIMQSMMVAKKNEYNDRQTGR